MRFLTADYLFPLDKSPIQNGVLQISNKGEVINVFSNNKSFPKTEIEHYRGVLCPGFINSHCHLELSHLAMCYKKGSGLLEFIKSIKQAKDHTINDIKNSIEIAENQLLLNGVVGVGDVCNTSNTLEIKCKNNLKYYNFIETFSVYENEVLKSIRLAEKIRKIFRSHNLKATIVPHSPYSVHPDLLHEVLNRFDKYDDIITTHFQESNIENKLFKEKKGELLIWLNSINASADIWRKKNHSLDIIKEMNNIRKLLVHNTFSESEDLLEEVYYCTCPKANLYIENHLPNYSLFNPNMLCVGTDSLASNDSLSILDEIYVIQENSDFDLNTLLKIASRNGAEALGFSKLGTFTIGKSPGVILIQNLNGMKISDTSTIKRLC